MSDLFLGITLLVFVFVKVLNCNKIYKLFLSGNYFFLVGGGVEIKIFSYEKTFVIVSEIFHWLCICIV